MVKEILKRAMGIHQGYVSEQRYASAGYDVGKGYEVEEPVNEELKALKEAGINTKEDLAAILSKVNIDGFRIQLQHEPYINTYDCEGKYKNQERNPFYAKELSGFTFDETYAFIDWMDILPGDYPNSWRVHYN